MLQEREEEFAQERVWSERSFLFLSYWPSDDVNSGSVTTTSHPKPVCVNMSLWEQSRASWVFMFSVAASHL